jgi:hypothetical protein
VVRQRGRVGRRRHVVATSLIASRFQSIPCLGPNFTTVPHWRQVAAVYYAIASCPGVFVLRGEPPVQLRGSIRFCSDWEGSWGEFLQP